MKQQGKTWLTPEGHETLAKYLPAHEKLFEKLGQKIAAEAVSVEKKLHELKYEFIEYCKEALRNNPDKGITQRFTFYTFDREFKIEFDIKDEYVRVYSATKKNPTSKDYEQVIMDFSRAKAIMKIGSTKPTEDDIKRAKKVADDHEAQFPEAVVNEVPELPSDAVQQIQKEIEEDQAAVEGPDGPAEDKEEQPSLFSDNTGRMEFES